MQQWAPFLAQSAWPGHAGLRSAAMRGPTEILSGIVQANERLKEYPAQHSPGESFVLRGLETKDSLILREESMSNSPAAPVATSTSAARLTRSSRQRKPVATKAERKSSGNQYQSPRAGHKSRDRGRTPKR